MVYKLRHGLHLGKVAAICLRILYDPAMVEWFANIVENRKKNHNCATEEKEW